MFPAYTGKYPHITYLFIYLSTALTDLSTALTDLSTALTDLSTALTELSTALTEFIYSPYRIYLQPFLSNLKHQKVGDCTDTKPYAKHFYLDNTGPGVDR
jgi:hypothetical protein